MAVTAARSDWSRRRGGGGGAQVGASRGWGKEELVRLVTFLWKVSGRLGGAPWSEEARPLLAAGEARATQ